MASTRVNYKVNNSIINEIQKKTNTTRKQNNSNNSSSVLFPNQSKSEAINSKTIGIFDHKNFLSRLFYNIARILSFGLKESRAPQILRQLSDLSENLNKLIVGPIHEPIIIKSDEQVCEYSKKDDTILIRTYTTEGYKNRNNSEYRHNIICLEVTTSVEDFKAIIQPLLKPVFSKSGYNGEFSHGGIRKQFELAMSIQELAINCDAFPIAKLDLINRSINLLTNQQVSGEPNNFQLFKNLGFNLTLKQYQELHTAFDEVLGFAIFGKQDDEANNKLSNILIPFVKETLENQDNWINFMGGFKTELINITDENLEDPTTIRSAENLYQFKNGKLTLERNVTRKTTTFSRLSEKLESNDKVLAFNNEQKSLFYYALDQLEHISNICSEKVTTHNDVTLWLIKNEINIMADSIRNSKDIREKCINQAIILMAENSINHQLNEHQIQDVKVIFLNEAYHW